MKQITIAPLSTPFTMTHAAWTAISSAQALFLQTERHPSAKPVLDAGLDYRSMDDLYETADDFDALNRAIAERLTESESCVYAVPGDGCFEQESAIRDACGKKGFELVILPGVSYAKAAFPAFQEGTICTANTMPKEPDVDRFLCIQEIDTRMAAGEVKLHLERFYPDELKVKLAEMTPDGAYSVSEIALYELDQREGFFAGTVLLVPPVGFFDRTRYLFCDLCAVMERLRAPDGCPWDREQTHESIKGDLIEECYELLDAIDERDDDHIIEELGDVLMLIVFHSVIAKEQGRFDADDVSDAVVKKLIYRHPHVFGDKVASTAGEVLANWDTLKAAQRNRKTQTEALCEVPKRFPALMRAAKVQKRAGKVGFDWNSAEEAFPKIGEEANELLDALHDGTNTSEEAGDLLFAAVNVIRLLKLDPEQVLHDATDKFINRFGRMEQLAREDGTRLESLSFDKQNEYWDKAKSAE